MFQSTHPHGVRHRTAVEFEIRKSFNPRTRTGCDPIFLLASQIPTVSIHAPARGATIPFVIKQADNLFQSTHPHGVRQALPEDLKLAILFQSTHPHGVRLKWFPPPSEPIVSIHAPARGATNNPKYPHLKVLFQSTHPHGVRLSTIKGYPSPPWFQSTHPHGVRPQELQADGPSQGFNPRTRTGCDLKAMALKSNFDSFNPRTRTGCDQIRLLCMVLLLVSIHAPARGATR